MAGWKKKSDVRTTPISATAAIGNLCTLYWNSMQPPHKESKKIAKIAKIISIEILESLYPYSALFVRYQ